MHIITARVIHGIGRGRTLGFPTANCAITSRMTLPPDGVYAAWATVRNHWYRAAVSVGKNKTFRAQHDTIEAHLIDFHGSLYGKEITLVFVQRLRGMKQFQSVSMLVRQIRQDIRTVRDTLVTSY